MATAGIYVLSVADNQDEISLLPDKKVRFNKSPTHGYWNEDENFDLVIVYDKRGDAGCAERDRFRRVPRAHAWVLYSRNNCRVWNECISLLLPKLEVSQFLDYSKTHLFAHIDRCYEQDIKLLPNAMVCFNDHPPHGNWSISGDSVMINFNCKANSEKIVTHKYERIESTNAYVLMKRNDVRSTAWNTNFLVPAASLKPPSACSSLDGPPFKRLRTASPSSSTK